MHASNSFYLKRLVSSLEQYPNCIWGTLTWGILAWFGEKKQLSVMRRL